jgi:hypothetical protein
MILKQMSFSDMFFNMIRDKPYFKDLITRMSGLITDRANTQAIDLIEKMIRSYPEAFGFSFVMMLEPRDQLLKSTPVNIYDNSLKPRFKGLSGLTISEAYLAVAQGDFSKAFDDKVVIEGPFMIAESRDPKYPDPSAMFMSFSKGVGPTLYHTFRKRSETIFIDPVILSRVQISAQFPQRRRFKSPRSIVDDEELELFEGTPKVLFFNEREVTLELVGEGILAIKMLSNVEIGSPEPVTVLSHIGSST